MSYIRWLWRTDIELPMGISVLISIIQSQDGIFVALMNKSENYLETMVKKII